MTGLTLIRRLDDWSSRAEDAALAILPVDLRGEEDIVADSEISHDPSHDVLGVPVVRGRVDEPASEPVESLQRLAVHGNLGVPGPKVPTADPNRRYTLAARRDRLHLHSLGRGPARGLNRLRPRTATDSRR